MTTKTLHATHRLDFEGAVDADGHILEPPDLWETYLEPRYRDRALRFVTDDDGLEALEIGGEPSMLSRKGSPSVLGAMGDPDLRSIQLDPDRTYLREAPYGSMDPDQRIELLDAEGIDAAVLYTTVGLLWEAELDDPELSQAYTRAYNRWICEFCAGHDRLVPTAHLSLSDPVAAARGAGAGRGGGREGRLRLPVHPRRPAARPPRQRPACSPRRRTSASRSRSTRPSSRSGRRARGWVAGRTSASCASWPR